MRASIYPDSVSNCPSAHPRQTRRLRLQNTAREPLTRFLFSWRDEAENCLRRQFFSSQRSGEGAPRKMTLLVDVQHSFADHPPAAANSRFAHGSVLLLSTRD